MVERVGCHSRARPLSDGRTGCAPVDGVPVCAHDAVGTCRARDVGDQDLARKGRVGGDISSAVQHLPRVSAPSRGMRKRYHHILNPAIEDAVKQGLLSKNRLEDYRSNGRRTRVRQKSEQIDKRICPNIEQFRRLHATMMTLERLGPMIATYFALMFWAALRPEEAVNVRWSNFVLPATDNEWGELILDSAAPTVGSKWTLDGVVRELRELRELKACEIGDTRVVPLCPELVAILRRHRAAHRKCPNGQVFWGERTDLLSDSTCRSMLNRARKKAFTAEEQTSPVAKTPYDFRHACITRWLNALIPVADVAKWSGNSPAIIHRKYEHCVAAQMKRLQALIEAADRDATMPIEITELAAA
jgi:integrase